MKDQSPSKVAASSGIMIEDVVAHQSSGQLPLENASELNPGAQPVPTENVPMTHHPTRIHRFYLASNILLNFFYLLACIFLPIPGTQEVGVVILIALICTAYILYVITAYSTTQLLFLVRLQPFQEYENIYQSLVNAYCTLNFVFVAPKNHIDEVDQCIQHEYTKVNIKDHSGKLYNIERHYKVAAVKYDKRYYYETGELRHRVRDDFNAFVDKCNQQVRRGGRRKRLIGGQERIDLKVEGLQKEIGFEVDSSQCYRGFFIFWVLLGFGAYYEWYMLDKVLRYQMQITKEICSKNQQSQRI